MPERCASGFQVLTVLADEAKYRNRIDCRLQGEDDVCEIVGNQSYCHGQPKFASCFVYLNWVHLLIRGSGTFAELFCELSKH